MFTPEELYALSRIESRRRVRRWMLGLQVGMVVFFCDQILKTWCAKRLPEGKHAGILGQDVLSLVHFPEVDPPSVWLAVALWSMLFAFALIRDKKANLTETLAFAFALAGGFSDLLSQYAWKMPLRTFALALPYDRMVAFNLAELAVWAAVAGLWIRLSRTVVGVAAPDTSQSYGLPS